jgi:nitronate monooxygenase
MALPTAFTDMFGISHPVALAPMGGPAGAGLAAAVSDGGGLGLLGGSGHDAAWCERELAAVAAQTKRPRGIGFLTWALTPATLDAALSHRPAAVMLSFGDPAPFAEAVRVAGARLIVQVTDLDEARRALDVGADVVVAQGGEAGGHGGRQGRGTLPFVPAVIDLAGATPVLAAGGIADGRGLAAVLALGAAGALVGTRFQASREALVDPKVVNAIVARSGDDTERGRVLDIARGSSWPARYTARTLRNDFLDEWRGREDELAADDGARRAYAEAAATGDLAVISVWAGEAIDLIDDVPSAADLVPALVADAEAALAHAVARR